jgi:hypothetical protein
MPPLAKLFINAYSTRSRNAFKIIFHYQYQYIFRKIPNRQAHVWHFLYVEWNLGKHIEVRHVLIHWRRQILKINKSDLLVGTVGICTRSMDASIFVTALIDILETILTSESLIANAPITSQAVIRKALSIVFAGSCSIDRAVINVITVCSPISLWALASVLVQGLQSTNSVLAWRSLTSIR